MHRILTESGAAIGLLTRIPLGRRISDRPGAAAFAVVGAGVAALAAVPYLGLAGPAREPVLGAIAAVAVTVVLTGAIHLDGLADTADALLARDAASAERARKDPAVGPGGLVTIVLVVAGEIAALASLASTADPPTATLAMVSAGGAARTVPVILARTGLGSNREGALGSWFSRHVTPTDGAINAVAVAVLLAALAATGGLLAAAAVVGGLAIGIGSSWLVMLRRGGLDGDAFGASVELTYLAILAAVAVVI